MARKDSVPQRSLLESERSFRLLVEGVIDYAIYMVDPEGIVANWNQGAERIKGYSAEDVVGRHFGMFYPPEDRRPDCPRVPWRRRASTEGSKPRAGASARTERNSWPRW